MIFAPHCVVVTTCVLSQAFTVITSSIINIKIDGKQRLFNSSVEKDGNLTLKFSSRLNIHSLNVHSSKNNQKIAHGTKTLFSLVNSNTQEKRVYATFNRNDSMGRVTYDLTFLRLIYEDEQKLSIYATTEDTHPINDTIVVKETKEVVVHLLVIRVPEDCSEDLLNVKNDTNELKAVICSFPAPTINWQTKDANLGSGFIQKVGPDKYIASLNLSGRNPWRLCGNVIRIVAEGVTGKKMKEFRIFKPKLQPHAIKNMVVNELKNNCIEVEWDRQNSGLCNITYFIKFQDKTNKIVLVVNTSVENVITKCVPEEISTIAIYGVYRGVVGNTTVKNITGIDIQGKIKKAIKLHAILAMLFVFVFFVIVFVAVYWILKSKEKTVKDNLKKVKTPRRARKEHPDAETMELSRHKEESGRSLLEYARHSSFAVINETSS